MNIFKKASELKAYLDALKLSETKSIIGFVPTMGALHEGHLSLILKAKQKATTVVCSIFVNPTQFNNPDDLKKYPRTIENDLKLLENTGCDLVYLPDVEDVYPNGSTNFKLNVDFGNAAKILEGAFRPGHFDGVAQVVYRLFDIVKPNFAVFGQKDLQQTVIIKTMVKNLDLPIEIIIGETLRNEDGLALSSRNMLLNEQEKIHSLIIYKTLKLGKELFKTNQNLVLIKNQLIDFFNQGKLKLEYLEFINADNFTVANENNEPIYCCIAAYCNQIRLIDNLRLN